MSWQHCRSRSFFTYTCSASKHSASAWVGPPTALDKYGSTCTIALTCACKSTAYNQDPLSVHLHVRMLSLRYRHTATMFSKASSSQINICCHHHKKMKDATRCNESHVCDEAWPMLYADTHARIILIHPDCTKIVINSSYTLNEPLHASLLLNGSCVGQLWLRTRKLK